MPPRDRHGGYDTKDLLNARAELRELARKVKGGLTVAVKPLSYVRCPNCNRAGVLPLVANPSKRQYGCPECEGIFDIHELAPVNAREISPTDSDRATVRSTGGEIGYAISLTTPSPYQVKGRIRAGLDEPSENVNPIVGRRAMEGDGYYIALTESAAKNLVQEGVGEGYIKVRFNVDRKNAGILRVDTRWLHEAWNRGNASLVIPHKRLPRDARPDQFLNLIRGAVRTLRPPFVVSPDATPEVVEDAQAAFLTQRIEEITAAIRRQALQNGIRGVLVNNAYLVFYD